MNPKNSVHTSNFQVFRDATEPKPKLTTTPYSHAYTKSHSVELSSDPYVLGGCNLNLSWGIRESPTGKENFVCLDSHRKSANNHDELYTKLSLHSEHQDEFFNQGAKLRFSRFYHYVQRRERVAENRVARQPRYCERSAATASTKKELPQKKIFFWKFEILRCKFATHRLKCFI